ncbi:hypothetical protein Sliba_73410 [Streptomyces nigrescens]|uniref:Uncharacterized protein n=1 Tax=Streptomyces nigrescens TaxID=1920 RepID=A0A640TTG1_STRNI|nr:hypothetical protein Sliba_73410 [Streptomyces libani subsp. libani]GGW07889.1 hypothetical protein GCM10010500_77510 [Streptomyces libani subsp. libani]
MSNSSSGRISSVRIVALTLRRSQHVREWGSGIGETRADRAPRHIPARSFDARHSSRPGGTSSRLPGGDVRRRHPAARNAAPVRHQYVQPDGGRFPRRWHGSSRVLSRCFRAGVVGHSPALWQFLDFTGRPGSCRSGVLE